MAVLAYSTLILLFVPSIQAGSFQTECESYTGRSLFYSDSFCYTKEKSPYCRLFPNGEIVGQVAETLWDVLGQGLNDDFDIIDYQTSNLRAPFGPGQPIQIVGSGIQTPSAEYTRYGFNLGFFELSVMFNHAASSTSVYVKEGNELTAHTNMISFGPDEQVTFEFVVDDNHRMQIYANGAVLLGNLTAPANLTSIGTWGAFDVVSINAGERFYGPYKDCPRIGLQKENPLGEWIWTDTSELFLQSGSLEWETGQPDNAANEESCACLHLASKVLRDIFCDDVAERICRYPTPPEPPSTPVTPAEGGYENCLAGRGLQEPLLLGKGERCLQVGAVQTNWNDAMDHCNSLGGHLFHIYNQHDYIQIVEWFKKLRQQGLSFPAFVGYKKESTWTPAMPLSHVAWMKDKQMSAQIQLADLPGFDFMIESPYILLPENIYGIFGTCGSETPFYDTNCDDPKGPQGKYLQEGWPIEAVAVCQYRPLSSNKSFKGKRNKMSEGKLYNAIWAQDATECASQCAEELQCQGFNVIDLGGTLSCEFVSEGASQRSSDGTIYYEKHSIVA